MNIKNSFLSFFLFFCVFPLFPQERAESRTFLYGYGSNLLPMFGLETALSAHWSARGTAGFFFNPNNVNNRLVHIQGILSKKMYRSEEMNTSLLVGFFSEQQGDSWTVFGQCGMGVEIPLTRRVFLNPNLILTIGEDHVSLLSSGFGLKIAL